MRTRPTGLPGALRRHEASTQDGTGPVRKQPYRRPTEAVLELLPPIGSRLAVSAGLDGLRITDLGQRAGLSKQTMTTMIRLMEDRRLVERRPDPRDRRAARIFLTERSRAFRNVAAQALDVMDTLVKSEIEPDQIDAARGVLRVIARLGSQQ